MIHFSKALSASLLLFTLEIYKVNLAGEQRNLSNTLDWEVFETF